MRLWSVHPAQLDRVGLVACWRESLLAQKVLRGQTKGYTQHPQLVRFRAAPDPIVAIASYLEALADEATNRGYRFDRTRIVATADPELRLPLTSGQLAYEWDWLQHKLSQRTPDLAGIGSPKPHPIFELHPGPTADWEVPVKGISPRRA